MRPRHCHADDVCRWLVLLDCFAELVTFLVFLASYEARDQLMISDALFASGPYAVTLTVFLFVRLVFGVMYVFSRHYSSLARGDHGTRQWFMWAHLVAYAGFALSAFGWVWLCRYRQDPDHTAGVIVFSFGTVCYSLCLVLMARLTEYNHMKPRSTTALAVLVVGGVTAVVFAGLYIAKSPSTWAVEHAAYALHLVFWGVFFSYHWHVQHVLGEEQRASEFGMVQQCQPLLFTVRPVMPQIAVPI